MTTPESNTSAPVDAPATLIVDLSPVWGGAQASLCDWVTAAPLAWRKTAKAIVACDRLANTLRASKVTVDRIELRGDWRRSAMGVTRWWLDVCGVRKRLRDALADCEVVYLNGVGSASPWLLPGLAKKPLVLHLRDVRGSRWLAKRAAGKATAIIAISEYQAGVMRGRWTDERVDKLQVVPNGVATIKPTPRETARKRLKLPADAKVAVLAADFVSWKRHERLLGALALSGGSCGVLAGGCRDDRGRKLKRDLEALAVRLRLEPRVRFPGSMPMADVLGAADVLVSAADDEPFGRTVVEAMQVGLPVVAMPTGGPAESLADYDGAVIAEGEPPLISAALREAMTLQPTPLDHWSPASCAEKILGILATSAGK